MATRGSRRAYKEVRLQQLRSFCETARLGSLAAAAGALGVSQPTVWEQVHALEKEFDALLIEPHGRGCRITDMGKLLAELADPLVAGIDSLKKALQARRTEVEARLTVAAPQRILVEDLPDVINVFMRQYPRVRLCLLERQTGQVATAVDSGEVDLGISSDREPGAASPRLTLEPAYPLDALLIMPRDHPLARRRQINPEHLKGYPLVNAPEGFSRPEVAERLRKLGVFEVQPRHVEAVTSAVIRQYVALGLGVGLVLGRPARIPDPGIVERSMSQHFGQAGISLIWRKGALPSPPARAFADSIQQILGTKQ
ncbi:MAG: LysR family transcriptional regulator [Planctomycetia bacterium]|nr:LysR family transcriptional regulator [Planctomycetia bacterium]